MLKNVNRNAAPEKQPLPVTPQFAPVAQLDRATDSDSVGRRFDSCWVQHNFSNLQEVVKLKNHYNTLRQS
jgi:hypothetical protein